DLTLHETSHLYAFIRYGERRIQTGFLHPLESELAASCDFADDVEIIFAEHLCKFVDHGGKETSRSRIHVFHRIQTEAVDVRECDPEFVDVAKMAQSRRNLVLVNAAGAARGALLPVVEIFQAEKITIRGFRKIVEVIDVPFACEGVSVLKLGRPDCSIGKRVRVNRQIDWLERKHGYTACVAKSAHGEFFSGPCRVICLIAKYVARMVHDNVEDDADSHVVCSVD